MPILSDFSWYEFQQMETGSGFYILPVGSLEQHGMHLPLGTDTMVAEGFAKRLAMQCQAIVLPAIPMGVVFRYRQWPGTIALSPKLFQDLIFQIGKGVHKQKGRKLLVLSGHDENKELLVTVSQRLHAHFGMDIIVAEWAHMALEELCALLSSENEIHGGELLTSLMLHWYPALVKTSLIHDHVETPSFFVDDFHGLKNVFRTQSVLFQKEKANGVSGFPSKASKETGAQIERIVLQKLAEMIKKADW